MYSKIACARRGVQTGAPPSLQISRSEDCFAPLYKLDALRATWTVKRRRKAMKFAPARTHEHSEAETYHQRQLFSKFSKVEIFDPTCVTAFRLPCKFLCSDFLIRGPTWTYSNHKKILVLEMNLQNSRKSRLNTRILPKPLSPIDRKFPVAAVLLYKLNALRATWRREDCEALSFDIKTQIGDIEWARRRESRI